MSTEISSLNLNDDGEMYVPLEQRSPPPALPANDVQPTQERVSTTFVPKNNLAPQQQATTTEMMDSTPISELMLNGEDQSGILNPPMIQGEPRMQSLMMQAPPQTQMGVANQPPPKEVKPDAKNAFGMTDDQILALLAAVAAGAAVSKPVQDFLSQKIPKFVNEQGNRSLVGLASTGAVAGAIWYLMRGHVIKP